MREPVLISALALIALLLALPAAALAADDYPDFYGTIVVLSFDQKSVTLALSQAERITVDVAQLGREPWDNGAFRLDNVVQLRTMRVSDRFVATGWEQARGGSQNFSGTEPQREDPQKRRKEN